MNFVPGAWTQNYWANSSGYYGVQGRRKTFPDSPRLHEPSLLKAPRKLGTIPRNQYFTKSMDVISDSSDSIYGPRVPQIPNGGYSRNNHVYKPHRPARVPNHSHRVHSPPTPSMYGSKSTALNNNGKVPTASPVNNWDFLSPKQNGPPSVQFLREVNRRAKITEKSLLYLKILSFVHLLLGLVMLALEWAKILLLWMHLERDQSKVSLTLRAVYPIFVVAVGCLGVAAGALNSKPVTQFLLVCQVATATTLCLLASHSPFVQSITEAMTLTNEQSRAMSPNLDHIPLPVIEVHPPFVFTTQTLPDPRAARNEQDKMGYFLKRRSLARGTLVTVKHMLITYACFTGMHFVITILCVAVCVKLLRVQ